jgi:hypothetical protein
MTWSLRTLLAAVVAVAALGLAGSTEPADGGTAVTVGQSMIAAPCFADDLLAIQAATGEAPGYAVPSGGGVVTSWSYEAGDVVGDLRLVLAVPTTAPGAWTIVAASPTVSPTPDVLNTFPAHLAAPSGAVLGLWLSESGMWCLDGGSDGDVVETAILDPGSSIAFTAQVTQPDRRLDVSAVVETDSGGVPPDLCPESDATREACPPPETTVIGRPRPRMFKHRIRISFTSSPGATFTCSVDGRPARPCHSPLLRHYSLGRHLVQVRATSPFGIAETAPARVVFRIVPRS